MDKVNGTLKTYSQGGQTLSYRNKVLRKRNSRKKVEENKLEIDVAYTSLLTRALETTQYILAGSDQQWIPVHKSWRLNERHYGALQGLNKDDAREKWGEEQVHQWRRSYDVQPPAESEEQRDDYLRNRRYNHLDKRMMPYSESLKDTLERVVPIWTDRISQHLLDGETVLVSAHGNSIRALIKYLEDLSDEEIVGYEIKTGAPLVYELTDDLDVKDKYYL